MNNLINEDSSGVDNLGLLLENNLEKAEIVLASQDITNKLQDMAEDLAKMVAHDIFPLVDTMKSVFGPEIASKFEEQTKVVIENATDGVRKAKDTILNYAQKLQDGSPLNDMADDDGSDDEVEGDFGPEEVSDEVEADSGDTIVPSEDDEVMPLGRSMKESFMLAESAVFEDEKYVTYGRSLLETETLGRIRMLLIKEAATSRADAVEILKKFNELSSSNPEGLAGWIGSKILAPSVFAQTDAPVVTASSSKMAVPMGIALSEGKSFKHSKDDDQDESEKAMKFLKRSLARKFKGTSRDSELIEYANASGHNKVVATVVMEAKRNAKEIATEVAKEVDRKRGEFDDTYISRRVKIIASYAIAESTANEVNNADEFSELMENFDENYVVEIIDAASTQLIVSVDDHTTEVKNAVKKINKESMAGEILSSFRDTYESVFKAFGTEKKEVVEKRDEEYDDDYSDRRRAKARDLARKHARKSKNSQYDDIDEGRKFDDEDEDDDYSDRRKQKQRDLERKKARKGKYVDLDEGFTNTEIVYETGEYFVVHYKSEDKGEYFELLKDEGENSILIKKFDNAESAIEKANELASKPVNEEGEQLSEKRGYDDEDDYEDRKRAKKRDLERKNARKGKNAVFDEESDIVVEKRFDDEDDDDDYNDRRRAKARDLARKHARKSKDSQYDEDANLVVEDEISENLSNADKKNAAGAMSKIANRIATDRSSIRKPISTVTKDMNNTERSAVNKMVNQMRKSGKPPKNVGDLVSGADGQF